MILGLAVAQDPNYRNYQQDDGRQTDRRPTSTTPIPILHWNKQQEHDGTYKTRYNHIFHNLSQSDYFKKCEEIFRIIISADIFDKK